MTSGMGKLYFNRPARGPEDWTITLAERPVHISRAQDIAMFGRPFSHPFLVLKNAGDNVLSEIHASWRRGSPMRTRLSQVFDKTTGRLCSERVNRVLASTGNLYPRCNLYNTRGATQYGTKVEEHLLFQGPPKSVNELWHSLVDMFGEVNERRTPYYRYARRGSGFGNCQILMREALERVEQSLLQPVPELKLAQTGWTAAPKTDIGFRL